MSIDDLQVQTISDALHGKTLDLVVSGSIGAVESVRFIRALRRLACEVQPWLTGGGAQFTTETALAWAAARPCKTSFEGSASHIALHDACIVAPASASFIGKIAQGLTDSPASALVASYLGQKKPVFILPNMHDSLSSSPFVAANLEKISSACTILAPRREEGKQKFPEPSVLADDLAHLLSRNSDPQRLPLLLTMGTTRGYIDEVRYISNYSSGALGTQIAHEFYRNGFPVHVVSGPCPHQPTSYSRLIEVETNAQMSEAVQSLAQNGLGGAIFAASVLDFVPSTMREGKIRSDESLKVDFIKTSKIIGQLTQSLDFKVGFKLETNFTKESAALAQSYLERYQLSHLVLNLKSEVSAKEHRALVYAHRREPHELIGKAALARYLVQEARNTLPQ